jgi:exopolysaccharide biosynthesis polyprenyl glycosylphosphotransferase
VTEQLAPLEAPGAGRALPVWLDGGLRTSPRSRTDVLWPAGRAVTDLLSLLTAAGVSGVAQPSALGTSWGTAVIVLTLVAYTAAGLYLPRERLQVADELRRAVVVTAFVILGIAALALATGGRSGMGDAAVVHWLLASAMVCTARVAAYGAQRATRLRSGGRPTLIVGAGEIGHRTAQRLLNDRMLGLRPIGFLDKEPMAPSSAGPDAGASLPVLGASWDLEQIAEVHGVEHVVVAFSTAPDQVMVDIVRRCWRLGLGVHVVPRLFEVEGRRVRTDHLGALPIVSLRSADPLSWQFELKYAIDRVIAGISLLVLAPALAAIALAILVTMGRPVLFRQRRVGRDGRVFDMLKFRTMRGGPDVGGEADARWAALILAGTGVDPDTALAADDGEDRRTPVGTMLRKCSLDELPQLWNVLRGDMSIVGPRPERAHYVERFESAVYRYPERHRVKSGLTGWAQVNGLRGETSLEDRIEWDNFYIENWTPWLDVKILTVTLPALLNRRGT